MKANPEGQEIVSKTRVCKPRYARQQSLVRHASLATISSWVVVGTLALVLVSLGTGCVDNDKSLVIVYNVAPDSSCKFAVQTGTAAIFLGAGLFDVNAGHVYYLSPQVENFMPTNLNQSEKDLNAMAVQVERFEITYSWLVGRNIIESSYPELMAIESQDPFNTYVSGIVSAADTSGEPGKMALTGVPLFSPQVNDLLGHIANVDILSVVLGMRIRVYGHTLGGTPMQSNEFVYSIEFCRNCTIGVVCCAADPAKAKAATFCIYGQDYPQPCSC